MALEIKDIPDLFGMGPLLGDMPGSQVANAVSSIIQGEEPDLNRAKLNIPMDQFDGFNAIDPMLTGPMEPIPPPTMGDPSMLNIPEMPGLGVTDPLVTSPDMTGIPMPSIPVPPNPSMLNVPQPSIQNDVVGVDPVLLRDQELINNLQSITGQGSSNPSMLNIPDITNMTGSGFDDETVVSPMMPVATTSDVGNIPLSLSTSGDIGSQIGVTGDTDTEWMKDYPDINALQRALALESITGEQAMAWLRNPNYGNYGAFDAKKLLDTWIPKTKEKNVPEVYYDDKGNVKSIVKAGVDRPLLFDEWHEQVFGTKTIPGGQTNVTRGNQYKSYFNKWHSDNSKKLGTIDDASKAGGGDAIIIDSTDSKSDDGDPKDDSSKINWFGDKKDDGNVNNVTGGNQGGGNVNNVTGTASASASADGTLPSDLALKPGDAYSQYIRSFFPGAGTGELARLSADPDKLYYGFNPNYGRYLLGLTDIPTITEGEAIKGSLPMAGTFSNFLGRDYRQPLSAIRSKFGGLRDYLRAISPGGVGIEGAPDLGGFGTTYTTDPTKQDILSSAIAALGYAPGASSRAYSGLGSVFDAFKFKYSNPFEAQNRFADWVTKAYAGNPSNTHGQMMNASKWSNLGDDSLEW